MHIHTLAPSDGRGRPLFRWLFGGVAAAVAIIATSAVLLVGTPAIALDRTASGMPGFPNGPVLAYTGVSDDQAEEILELLWPEATRLSP